MNKQIAFLTLTMLVVATALQPKLLQAQSIEDSTTPLIENTESFSNSEVSSLQSTAERSMDFLDQQIAPPTEGAALGSGIKLFSNPKSKRSAIKTAATLTLVLSLFFLAVFAWRLKSGVRGTASQKRDERVLSVLGQIPFVHGQELQLVRLGTRLLLVASSPKGSQTLAEITDPREVLQLQTAMQEGRMESLTAALQASAARGLSTPHSGHSTNGGISLGSHNNGHHNDLPPTGRTLLEA